MRKLNSKTIWFCSAAATALCATTGAFAQQAAAQSDSQIETVTVTAQHRTEKLQDVPISAQVVSGATLSTQNLNNIYDLAEDLPGVHVGESARSSDMYVRGTGSGGAASFEQSVATFVDDVYYGRSRATNGTFLDIDDIEVLKGPQSTFFGDNAIAGALNITTKKPTDYFDGSARILVGTFGQYVVEGAVGGPITDELSARLALSGTGDGIDDSGYVKDVNTGKRGPVDRNWAGRVQLDWHPTSDFDALLKVEGAHTINNGLDGVLGLTTNCPAPAPFAPVTGYCAISQLLHVPTGRSGQTNGPNANGFVGGMGTDYDTATYELTSHYHQWGQDFTSVSAYTDYHFILRSNTAVGTNNGPLYTTSPPNPLFSDFFGATVPEHYHQFSQEFRVSSPLGQTFEYMAGVYFQTDDLYYESDVNEVLADAAIPPLLAPFGAGSEFRQNEHDYAAYVSGTWHIIDDLSLSGGLRATWVQKSYDLDTYYGFANTQYGHISPPPATGFPGTPYAGTLCTPTSAGSGYQALLGKNTVGAGGACANSGGRDDHALLPSVKLQYQIDPDVMAYAKYERGFLAGGFNSGDTTGIAADIPFAPESVDAYEVGVKSEWFDHTVLANVDVFLSNYSNLQVTSGEINGTAISNIVTNVGASRTQGVEAELQWIFDEHVRFGADITYDDSHYVTFPNAGLTITQAYCSTYSVPPAPPKVPPAGCVAAGDVNGLAFQNLAGRPTLFSPEWSGSLSAQYSTLFLEGYKFTAELSPYFSSSYFTPCDNGDDPLCLQPSYIKLDARVTFDSPDKRWSLDLIGKNLTDQTVKNFTLGWPNTTGGIVYGKDMPKNFAVQLRFHW